MSDSFVEAVVIGAGVVGLATARALALAGLDTILLESETRIGTGISARSSEVIHAGLHYPPGSLKARFCVAGREALYAYCAAHDVPHRRCGKLTVATDTSQIGRLEAIAATGVANGVTGLDMLGGDAAMRLEPGLDCVAALYSPCTGIVDSHAFMQSLRGGAEAAGAMIAFASRVEQLVPGATGLALHLAGGARLVARVVVNAAGLDAVRLANTFAAHQGRPARPFYISKGNYFTLQGRAPFTRLIYPLPEPGGIGIHLTLDMGGQARFGPDVEQVDAPDYTVDPGRAGHFQAAIQRYWPGLNPAALAPGYAGIRPKLNPPGSPAADFVVDTQNDPGFTLINLLGLESPGLTSALAIGEYVGGLVHG